MPSSSRSSNPHKMLLLLPCVVYCATCAPHQKSCARCALPCDDAHELEKHQSVRVYVKQRSERGYDKIHNVSSLFKGEGHCSVVVPDCSKWRTPITLGIYAEDKETVLQPLYIKTDIKPVSTGCDPEATSDRSKANAAVWERSHVRQEGNIQRISDDRLLNDQNCISDALQQVFPAEPDRADGNLSNTLLILMTALLLHLLPP